MMFSQDEGLAPGKWLKWFMVAMVICGVCSFWPDNRLAVGLGAGFGGIGISLARRQIMKRRSEK